MLKNILLPLDGSQATMDFALNLAKKHNSGITGIAVNDEPEIMLPEPVPAGAGEFVEHKHQKLMQKAAERSAELLENFRKACDKAGVKSTNLEVSGHPFEEILKAAFTCDVIILPLKGNFKAITQDKPCDTSKDVLQRTSRPVFLIPEKYTPAKTAIVTCDGGDGSSKTMQLAQLTGILGDLEISAMSIQSDEKRAAELSGMVRDFLHAHGLNVKATPVVSSDKPWNVLLDSIKKSSPDFVTMGAFEKSGIKEFFLGSFTKGMLEKSPAPLFIYH